MHRAATVMFMTLLVFVLLAAIVLAMLPDGPAAGDWRRVDGDVREWLEGSGEGATGENGAGGNQAGGSGAEESGAGGSGAGAGDSGSDGNGEPAPEEPAERAPARININEATAEELDLLPGIGPAKARAIIEYRETFGRFETPEQLMEVKGIGKKTFERLKDLIEL